MLAQLACLISRGNDNITAYNKREKTPSNVLIREGDGTRELVITYYPIKNGQETEEWAVTCIQPFGRNRSLPRANIPGKEITYMLACEAYVAALYLVVI